MNWQGRERAEVKSRLKGYLALTKDLHNWKDVKHAPSPLDVQILFEIMDEMLEEINDLHVLLQT